MKAKTMAIMLFFPLAKKQGVQEEGEPLHQVWEHDHILELACQPNQVQGILFNGDFVCQSRSIITTKPSSTVWIDANAKVSNSGLQNSVTRYSGYCVMDIEVNLCSRWVRRVLLVVEGDEEDVGN